MKRFTYIIMFLVAVMALLYMYYYQIIGAIKNSQEDLITVEVADSILSKVYIVVAVEDDTIFYEKIHTIKGNEFPRVYGKNRYYLQTDNTSHLISVSYNKLDTWSRSEVNLFIDATSDAVLVRWKRNHMGRKSYAVDTFPL